MNVLVLSPAPLPESRRARLAELGYTTIVSEPSLRRPTPAAIAARAAERGADAVIAPPGTDHVALAAQIAPLVVLRPSGQHNRTNGYAGWTFDGYVAVPAR